MNEKALLSALVYDRATYDRLKDYIGDDLSDQGEILYGLISEYYETDADATQVSLELIHDSLERKYPKHIEVFTRILDGLQPVSIPNMNREFLEFKRETAARKLGQALLGVDEREIDSRLQEYMKLHDDSLQTGGSDEHIHQGKGIADLLSHVSPENLIRIAPRSLNDRLDGGLPRGSHILVYAPPETGKSAFCITIAASFLDQGYKVLYVGNEDPHNMMLLRFYSCLSGMTKHEILKNPEKSEERARSHGYDNLVFASLSPGDIADVRRLVSKHKPDVVVVDQLPNLTSNLPPVEKLGFLAQEVRNIGKAHDLVMISVAQAGAHHKLVLDLGDVYFSNVAIQGAVDVMVGLGSNEEYDRANRRMVSLAKNKLSGNHEPFPVIIQPELSRILNV